MKEIVIVISILIFGVPQVVSADTSQVDASTSTPYISAGYTNFQTLGTGLSGTLSSVDISYFADMTYYGVKVSTRIEECSSDAYGDCVTVSEPVITPDFMPSNGVQNIDFVDYAFNHCKYYRLVLMGTGPFGSMGALRYHGSDGDSYIYGAYDGDGAYGDDIVDDLYFVLHGVDRLDRSANTPENLCVDPVIIVPGLLGSFEKDGVLLMDPILHAYDDIVATFLANGYVASSTLFTFPYNWRNSNVDTAILLKQKIDDVKNICNCSKVDIVAHSMGGLVTRQYVQSDTYGYDVDQVVFLATPHLGSPKAYLAWEGGAFPVPSVSDAVVYAILRSEAKHSGFSSVFDYIQNRPVASIKELLPIYDYLKIVDTDTGVISQYHYPNEHPANTFLDSLNNTVGRLSRVKYENIIGSTGFSTIGSIRTGTTSSSVRWQHGQPQNLILGSALELVDGDKTVPSSSAGLLNPHKTLVAEHTNVPDVAIEKTFNILTARNIQTLIREENNPDYHFLIILILSPVDVSIVAPDGKKVGYSSAGEINEIPGAFYTGSDTENEFIVIPNTLDGEYKIETVGTDDGEYTVAVSSVFGDTMIDTEYTATTKVGDVSRLVLDVDTSSPLQNLAISPEPPPVVVAVAETVPVSRSSGGGGRRAIQQHTPPVAASTSPVGVNPDTFMITMDIPVERFVALMTNQPSVYVDRSTKLIIQKSQITKDTNPTQTASVIDAIENSSSKSGLVGKIKEGFKKLFYKFKNQ